MRHRASASPGAGRRRDKKIRRHWGPGVDQRAFFHGKSLNAVDAKGRVSLPADMRAVIEKRARQFAQAEGEQVSERDLFIARHRDMPCLRAFDLGYEQTLFAEAEEAVEHLSGKERLIALERLQARLYGDLERTSFDQPGRMVLPPRARRLGNIGGLALFVGAGRIIHIWDPESFLADPDNDEDDKRDVREMLAERGARP